MNRMSGRVARCLALGACASTRPAPDIALDESVEIEAVPASESPATVRVVEVPTPLPLPAQLKPLPTPARQTPVNPRRDVASATQAARLATAKDGLTNAMQVWPDSTGRAYTVGASPRS